MYRAQSPRKYEEHAYVLDFNPRGSSSTVRGRDGMIVTVIGETMLTLLEVLGISNSSFDVGERLFIGRKGRTKAISVLGKMEYARMSASAQNELPGVVEKIVINNEARFVEYLNTARPLTSRIHALELIPGIGKTYMRTMLEEREIQKFDSYVDLQDRVGLKDPIKHITDRIIDEIAGKTQMNLFVKR